MWQVYPQFRDFDLYSIDSKGCLLLQHQSQAPIFLRLSDGFQVELPLNVEGGTDLKYDFDSETHVMKVVSDAWQGMYLLEFGNQEEPRWISVQEVPPKKPTLRVKDFTSWWEDDEFALEPYRDESDTSAFLDFIESKELGSYCRVQEFGEYLVFPIDGGENGYREGLEFYRNTKFVRTIPLPSEIDYVDFEDYQGVVLEEKDGVVKHVYYYLLSVENRFPLHIVQLF
jgi:hypothetical protein